MKLHLPVTLLRAVMALFATTTTFTSAWAEETEATNPTTITHDVTDNTVYLYGSGDENWKDAWREEWNADEIIITSGDQQKHDVTFKSDGAVTAYDSIIDAEKVTIENLGNVTIDGFLGNSSNTAIFGAVEYVIQNNTSFNYTNNKGVVLTDPGNDCSIFTFDGNGAINITDNSARLENHFTLGTAIEDIQDVVIKNTTGDITMARNTVESGQEWVSGAVVRIEGGLDFIGNQGNIDVSNNTSKIIDGASGDAHGGAILAFGVKISQTGGNISFNNNTASTQGSDYAGGGAISSVGYEMGDTLDSVQVLGNVTLSENAGNIEFKGNTVKSGSLTAFDADMLSIASGGAITGFGKVSINDNTGKSISFSENAVDSESNIALGGAITCQGAVEISGNKASEVAVGADEEKEAQSISFDSNTVASTTTACGGAIAADNSHLVAEVMSEFNAPEEVAIQIVEKILPSYVAINDNENIQFSHNEVISGEVDEETQILKGGSDAFGGAIYSNGDVTLGYVDENGTSHGNGQVEFVGNSVLSGAGYASGGAIYSLGNVTVSGNTGVVKFNENKAHATGASAEGGAITSATGDVNITDNAAGVEIKNNSVKGLYNAMGAVYAANAINVQNNGNVAIEGNSATESSDLEGIFKAASGGGLNAGQVLNVSGNGAVFVKGNSVSSANGYAVAGGVGALGVSLSGNDSLTFVKNTAIGSQYAGGGAVLATGLVAVSSQVGDVSFSGNDAASTGGTARGGAIAADITPIVDAQWGDILYWMSTHPGEALPEEYAGLDTREKVEEALKAVVPNSVEIAGNSSVSFTNNSALSGRIDAETGAVSYGGSAYGGAIYSNGDVVLSNNGDVSFGSVDGGGNTVLGYKAHGGAIYGGGNVTLSGNSSVSFLGNAAQSASGDAFGGAVYSSGVVSIENNTNVNFSGNTITCVNSGDGFGGAIYAGLNSGSSYENADFGHNVTLSGNGNVTFADNKIESEFRARGGAIYADGHITLSDNDKVTFSGNSVKSDDGGSAIGGAISTYLMMGDDGKDPDNYATIPVGVTLSGNKEITFAGNSATSGRATANGGAIYSAGKVEMTENSGNILFSGNSNEALSAYSAAGGAIAGCNGVVISGNTGESIKFEENLNKANGGNSGAGAVYAAYGNVSILDNKGVAIEFSGNRVEGVGRFNVLENDGSITTVDAAVIAGGAIGADASSVMIKKNGAVSFTDNKVIDEDAAPETTIDRNAVDVAIIAPNLNVTGGGAIMSLGNTEISGNEGVTLSGNSATSDSRTAMGGAIATVGSASISHNTGDVKISGNRVASKTGTAMGGAIFAQNGLSIVNNGNVTFSGNYEQEGDTYRLNSVVVAGGNVELAAAADKSITFYDAIRVGSGSKVELNSYSGQASTGAIVFSGANVVETLQQLKGEGNVSDSEISASLTSQINRQVSVEGGSLQVKDGAMLQMLSLDVKGGAELLIGAGSTVAVAVGSTVVFGADSEFTVQGLEAAATMSVAETASSTPAAAQIVGNVELAAGMTYTMDGAYTALVGTNDTLTLDKAGGYTFNVDESLAYTKGNTKYFVLFTGVEKLAGVDPSALTGIEFLTNIGYYDDIMLNYIEGTKAGGVLYISASVPEPTTATLSLLALAALAARRRRK